MISSVPVTEKHFMMHFSVEGHAALLISSILDAEASTFLLILLNVQPLPPPS